MVILFIITVVIIFIVCVIYNTTKKKNKNKVSSIVDSWILRGIKSGIKDIKYKDFKISIYFNNEISLLDAWNANKLYSWIHDGKIKFKDKIIFDYHELPSLSVRKKLNNLVEEFEFKRLNEKYIIHEKSR